MTQAPMPFAEWRPDLALLDNEFASVAENVFVDANSYLPFPGHKQLTTTALAADAVGLISAQTSSGAWKIYAGTTTKLYEWSGTAWTDATRTVGGNYTVAAGDLWRFQQVGVYLYATAPGNQLQRINIDSGTNFADVAGAPKARHISQIGPHTFLSGLDSNGRKLQWSAVEDPTGWTVGTNLSDEQEMPEGGQIQGTTGGEIGYVVQERAIRTIQYLPGDTNLIFTLQRVVQDRGCLSKYGFTVVNGVLYFLAEDGFYALAGQQLVPIGQDKINDWFTENSDPARRNLTLAFDFQHAHRIGWAFYGNTGIPTYNKIIIYDWALQRWSYATISAQIWAGLASPSINLDTDDPGDANDSNLDSPISPSLDSTGYMGGRPIVGAIDVNRRLSVLAGSNMAATLETAERHLTPGMRSFVSDVYVLDDAHVAGTVTIGWRDRLEDVVSWDNPVDVEQTTGSAPAYSAARLHRVRRSIPEFSHWSHAQGVLVEAQQDGMI